MFSGGPAASRHYLSSRRFSSVYLGIEIADRLGHLLGCVSPARVVFCHGLGLLSQHLGDRRVVLAHLAQNGCDGVSEAFQRKAHSAPFRHLQASGGLGARTRESLPSKSQVKFYGRDRPHKS